MRFFFTSGTTILIAALCLLAQQPNTPSQEQQASETRGMPARATPGDYQAHADAGKVTIGAEFFQHTVPSPEGVLNTDDYVVVEAGVFGPPGARTTVSFQDFSLRINGKKNPQPSEPYAVIFKSLKDPEWEPPVPAGGESKAGKTGISSSGGGGGGKTGLGGAGNDPPPVVHPPFKLQREWESRAKKEAFPEGDRSLPQAGLLFFVYRGKASGIHSLELIYSGSGGKASLSLQP
jgi:hypothetical protein